MDSRRVTPAALSLFTCVQAVNPSTASCTVTVMCTVLTTAVTVYGCRVVMLPSLVSPGASATRLIMGRSQGKKRNIRVTKKQDTRNLRTLQMEGKCHALVCVLGSDILPSHLSSWIHRKKELNRMLFTLPAPSHVKLHVAFSSPVTQHFQVQDAPGHTGKKSFYFLNNRKEN